MSIGPSLYSIPIGEGVPQQACANCGAPATRILKSKTQPDLKKRICDKEECIK